MADLLSYINPMTGMSSPDHPFMDFSSNEALDQYNIGFGATVYVDRAAHMATGGGRLFSIQDFSQRIGELSEFMAPGTSRVFVGPIQNTASRSAEREISSTSWYSYGLLTDEA